MWFAITTIYETTTHTDSYHQVAIYKLSAIRLFKKNPDNATIGVVFKKIIAALCEYEHSGRTPESLCERTCITLLRFSINPVDNLFRNVKICEKVENQVHGFTSHNMIDAVLK